MCFDHFLIYQVKRSSVSLKKLSHLIKNPPFLILKLNQICMTPTSADCTAPCPPGIVLSRLLNFLFFWKGVTCYQKIEESHEARCLKADEVMKETRTQKANKNN